jgi:hypothetical protein
MLWNISHIVMQKKKKKPSWNILQEHYQAHRAKLKFYSTHATG